MSEREREGAIVGDINIVAKLKDRMGQRESGAGRDMAGHQESGKRDRRQYIRTAGTYVHMCMHISMYRCSR